MTKHAPAPETPEQAPEQPALSAAAQAAVEAESRALNEHVQTQLHQAQIAWLSQRLHEVTVELADLKAAQDN